MTKNKKTFYIIYLLAFFTNLAYAFPLYMQSSFLETFTSLKYVGLYITIATSINLLIILLFPQLIKKFNNFPVMATVAALYVIGTLFLISSRHPLTVLVFFTVHFAAINLMAINLDIFLENISDNKKTGRIRTTYLTVVNTAVLLSPYIAGKLVGKENNFALAYIISSIMIFAVLVLMLVFKNNLNDRVNYNRRHMTELFSVLMKDKNMMNIFCLSFVLRFFYAIMVLYTPIYLNAIMGYSWGQIGIIFTIMLIPFVVIEMPAGKFADKYFGEKEMLVLGLIIMGVFTFLFPLVPVGKIFLLTAVLFCTRIGAALVESMQEVYFFKIVKKEDIDIINLFRDMTPFAWLAGSAIAVIILKLFSIHCLYFFLSFAIFASIISASKIKDTK